MKFEPILPGKWMDRKLSQTMLVKYSRCPRSALLYRLLKGEASTDAMQRGRAFHLVAQRAVQACVENGEVTIPPELVKSIVDEVLAEVPVPIEEHDILREMAWRWGSETAIDPGAVVACETLFTMNVEGWEVRCRIDFAELLEDGAAVAVKDWKTAKGAPSYEDISRKRVEPLSNGHPEGRLYMARNAQLVLYALALAFGVPVREEEVDGERVEVPEPFGVASRAQRFDLEFVYPAIEDAEGEMMTRPVSLSRGELEVYRSSLAATVKRLEESERTGDWPAVISQSACSECPAQRLCPIPAELNDHRGEINSMAQAAEAAEKLDRDQAEFAARREEIKRFAKAKGLPVRFGADRVFEFAYQEQTRIIDKDRFLEDVERAARYGEPLDRAKHIKTVKSTPFRARTLTADELAEEAGEEQ